MPIPDNQQRDVADEVVAEPLRGPAEGTILDVQLEHCDVESHTRLAAVSANATRIGSVAQTKAPLGMGSDVPAFAMNWVMAPSEKRHGSTRVRFMAGLRAKRKRVKDSPTSGLHAGKGCPHLTAFAPQGWLAQRSSTNGAPPQPDESCGGGWAWVGRLRSAGDGVRGLPCCDRLLAVVG